MPAETIAYHAPCHLRAQNIGLKSRDLLKLTGARVTVVQQCSGIDGMWGLRAENDKLSIPIAQKLAAELEQADGDVVAGDCHLANGAIVEQTGRVPAAPAAGAGPGLRHRPRSRSHDRRDGLIPPRIWARSAPAVSQRS